MEAKGAKLFWPRSDQSQMLVFQQLIILQNNKISVYYILKMSIDISPALPPYLVRFKIYNWNVCCCLFVFIRITARYHGQPGCKKPLDDFILIYDNYVGGWAVFSLDLFVLTRCLTKFFEKLCKDISLVLNQAIQEAWLPGCTTRVPPQSWRLWSRRSPSSAMCPVHPTSASPSLHFINKTTFQFIAVHNVYIVQCTDTEWKDYKSAPPSRDCTLTDHQEEVRFVIFRIFSVFLSE